MYPVISLKSKKDNQCLAEQSETIPAREVLYSIGSTKPNFTEVSGLSQMSKITFEDFFDVIVVEIPADYNAMNQYQRRSVREEYIRLQEGRCSHCGELLAEMPSVGIMEMPVDEKLFPDGFFNHPIHLHHNHDTGMTIGAVHNQCNAVLWQHHGE